MTAPRPRCPKCGKPVIKGGHQSDKSGKSGVQRWIHSPSERKSCRWHGTRPVGLEAAESEGIDPKTAKSLHVQVKRSKRAIYVITAAQNATPVNKPFFAALQLYCRKRNATLLVIPYRYKNPTSRWSQAAEDDDWWAPELARQLIDIRTDLNPNLVLLADIKTQPTASTPLTGFETISGDKSAIIGHPKLELTTVPAPQSKMAKILTTTGAVTEKNYIPSKAGKKGEFHHTFGAALVEIDGKRFHLRQINACTDGSFIDLDTEYKPSGETKKVRAAALVMGDSHIDFVDPKVVEATFGKSGIVAALKPEALVWHDIFDGYSGSHHHRGKVFTNLAKHRAGRTSVTAELERVFAFVDKHLPPECKSIFVPSNHVDHLRRWVEETDPRTDMENFEFLCETYLAMAKATTMTARGASTIDPFVYWAKRKLKSAARSVFLNRDDSHLIHGIEVGMHGDAGPNGARGSRLGFSKIGVKTIIGHSHSPGIRDGCYQVGTSSYMGLEYQRGPSSWLNCHALIYPNSKRSLVFVIDGRWRL